MTAASDTDRDDRAALLAALKWQLEAGADEAIAAEPVDRTKLAPPARAGAGKAAAPKDRPTAERPPAAPPTTPPQERRAAEPQTPAPQTPPPQTSVPQSSAPQSSTPGRPQRRQVWQQPEAGGALRSSEEAALAARQAAAKADSLEALRTELEAFDGCALKQTAKNLCFTDGAADARLLVMGEAPGAEEDRRGLPFVGAAGQMLDRMLEAIGHSRETDTLISNVIFWRPPGNRTPNDAEVAACLPFVERMIALADPDYLLIVGGAAAKTLLGTNEGVLKLRGRWFHYQNAEMTRPVPTLVTLHPAYLLRQPAAKRLAWRDLIALKLAIQAGDDPAAHSGK